MDLSIVSRATLKAMHQQVKVDQHRKCPNKGRSTSQALNVALSLAEGATCHSLSCNELAMVLANRFNTTNGVEFVDKDTLFKLWVMIDTELELRKDNEIDAHNEPIVEDVPSKTPFASVVGDDDSDHMELEAFAIRSIHAEVFDTEDYLG